MLIKDVVFEAIQKAPRCQFPEEIAASVPHLKIDSIRNACFHLLDMGKVKAMRKDRDNARISTVFYCRDEQVVGVEGLFPYEPIKRQRAGKPEPESPDMLLTLPIEGDNKVSSVTVTIECARKLYAQLGALFGGKA